MTPLISGACIDAEDGHFEHHLGLVRILCRYFNDIYEENFSARVKSVVVF